MAKFHLSGLIVFVMILTVPMTPVQAQATDFGPASLDWVDGERAKSGRGAVALSPKLTRAAAAHVGDMVQPHRFQWQQHRRPGRAAAIPVLFRGGEHRQRAGYA